jgi:hypothetical protein
VAGLFHRLDDPPELIARIAETGELRGASPRNIFTSDIPKAKAYPGFLPPNRAGFEFETHVEPDTGSPPNVALWSNGRPGVTIEGDYAKIKVKVTKIQP